MSNWTQEQLDEVDRRRATTGLPKRTERMSAEEYRHRNNNSFTPSRRANPYTVAECQQSEDRAVEGLVQPHSRIDQVTFFGRVAGMNGKDGLLRIHWTKKKKLIEEYKQVVYASGIHPFTGKVRVELTRYSWGVACDYDGLVSTGKLLLDAIVRCGIIEDDNMNIIAEREYKQVKVGKKEAQKTVVKIIPLY